MNTVEPIRDKEIVRDIADYLKYKNERDYVMFMFGIYTGLRISDILQFRVRDVKGKEYISIREKKTQKEKRFPINVELKKIITQYVKGKRDFEYLFKTPRQPNKPITRRQAYTVISEAGKVFGIENLGTHTMRKTFGYHVYQQTHNASLVMDILNHRHESDTLRYIGVDQDLKNETYNNLKF